MLVLLFGNSPSLNLFLLSLSWPSIVTKLRTCSFANMTTTLGDPFSAMPGNRSKEWFMAFGKELVSEYGFLQAPILNTTILLQSGPRNVVYRLIFKEPVKRKSHWGLQTHQSMIFKSPRAWDPSSIPEPEDFMEQFIEFQVLIEIPYVRDRIWPSLVRVPELFLYEPEKYCIIMEDVCPPDLGPEPKANKTSYFTLQEWCLKPREDTEISTQALAQGDGAIADAIGKNLGSFLARLHFSGGPKMGLKRHELSDEKRLWDSFGGNNAAREYIMKMTFASVFANLDRLEITLTEEGQKRLEVIIAEMSKEVLTQHDNLVMGAFS